MFDPVVPHAVGIVFFLDRTDIEKGAPRELCFFGIHGILDHSPNDVGSRTVQSADKDEVVCEELSEWADAFISKVGVGDEAVGGESAEREEGEFGIDGSGIGTKLGHQGFRSQNGRIFCDFERHAPHEDHDPDRIFLGLLNGEIFGKTEDGIWKNRLAAF